MKLLIYADPHWSSYSSLVRSRGEKYSTRLENLINTLNWIEIQAQTNKCDAVVCLGDFFDKSELNSEEITALQEVSWNPYIKHFMLVGNHEMGRSNLEHSSSHLFALIPNIEVIDEPYLYNLVDNTSLVFLPYIIENNRKPLKDYLSTMQLNENIIIFSHNDIAGIQMGQFVSTSGFTIQEIEENCNLFINGHIHNGAEIGDKIINLGNITGQNFSEDAFKYGHNAMILDTEMRYLEKLPNPCAMNFYKVDLTNHRPIIDDKNIQDILSSLKHPAVATIKINPDINFIVRDLSSTCENIIECRLITDGLKGGEPIESIGNEVNLDHIQKFQMYVMENIGKDDLTLNELERICK